MFLKDHIVSHADVISTHMKNMSSFFGDFLCHAFVAFSLSFLLASFLPKRTLRLGEEVESSAWFSLRFCRLRRHRSEPASTRRRNSLLLRHYRYSLLSVLFPSIGGLQRKESARETPFLRAFLIYFCGLASPIASAPAFQGTNDY